jgi:hypothetical protein
VRIWCSVFFAGIVLQFCPSVFAGEPAYVGAVSSPTTSAGQDSQFHTVDADSGTVNCCHVDPAHTFRDAALVSIASDTDLRIFPAVVTEHDETLWSSTSNIAIFPAPTLDHTAGRGRALYLTTLRLRI